MVMRIEGQLSDGSHGSWFTKDIHCHLWRWCISTNRKRVFDFLFLRHSNLGPILHCLRDIAGFL